MGAMSAFDPKIAPPPLPPRLVARPRLTSALNAAAQEPLTLLAAGAGSGKTVLLSSWATASELPVAWVSIDPSDNSPELLWPLVGASLRRAGVLGDGVDVALSYDEGDMSVLVTALVSGLRESAEVALVLDDAHLLTNDIVLEQFDALVRYGFPTVHLVLGCRSDPLLPLHRYRLAGQMTELRAADLAMTRREAAALLAAHGVTLPANDLEVLTQRTEGWVAGLRLSAMSMAGSKNPKRFVSQLAVDQGSVGEYLLEEVIARQPERIRRLLIETSVLETTTGALAAAITGIAESGELLAELARSNSFVIPLDHTGTHYRYHPLLLQVLRYLLKQQYRQAENDLRRRAARWYEEHGQPAMAVRFALSAADWMCATQIIAHGGVSQAFRAGQDLAEFALEDFSKFLTATTVADQWQPETELAWAVAALAQGEIGKARAHVAAARAAPLEPDLEESALLLALLAAQREAAVDEVDELADLLRASATSSDARMAAALRLAQATARYWNDGLYSYSEVEALLTDSVDLAIRSKSPEIELEALGFLKLAYAAVGRYEHLREVSARSRNVFRENPSVRLPAAHYLADAYTALMRMDVASTERALRKARQSPNFDAQPVLRMAVTLLNAWMLMSSGQPAEAHQVLAGSTDLDGLVPERLTRRRDHVLADIAVRLGRPNAALRMLGEDPTESNDPAVVAIGARAYIALGDGVAARRCLRPVLIEHESAMPLPLLIELLLVSAAVDDLSGDGAAAVGKVLRACDLARGRTVVPFNDMRGMLAGVLARHPEVRAAWPVPVELPSPNGIHRRRAPIELVESLTDRELVVLRRLASTMTTQEIADELCVSVNTVKTHIAAIYRKLPAGGRHDAVARARQLELL